MGIVSEENKRIPKVKKMIECPICKNTKYKESIQCSRLKKSVCISCCEKCEYYFKDDFYRMHRCLYGIKEQEEENKKTELKTRISKLEKMQEDLYRTGQTVKADDIVWKIVEIQRQIKKLEGK